jgi:hypothetical protein
MANVGFRSFLNNSLEEKYEKKRKKVERHTKSRETEVAKLRTNERNEM